MLFRSFRYTKSGIVLDRPMPYLCLECTTAIAIFAPLAINVIAYSNNWVSAMPQRDGLSENTPVTPYEEISAEGDQSIIC